MNGYKILADSYKKLAEEGNISREEAEKHCRIYNFLATCDDDDINIMFDSSAFNEISKSYMRLAVRRLADNGTIEEDQATAVRNEFAFLFDEKTAKEIMED